MSTWRREALSRIPDLRKQIEGAADPMALWITLQQEFEVAWTAQDRTRLQVILKFASWCISEAAGALPNDVSTAAVCGFYENLPDKRDRWPHFSRWFTKAEFELLESAFAYHLDEAQLAELKEDFRR